jgi:hypothetical protein
VAHRPGLERLALANQARHTTDAPRPEQLRRHRMNVNPDLHHHYVLDRQQRLRAETAAHRLAKRFPAHTRITRLLRRATDRPDAAHAASGPVG